MGILDAYTQLSRVVSGGVATNEMAVTGAPPHFVGTSFVSSLIDLTSSGIASRYRDVGEGEPLFLDMVVTEAFTGPPTALYTFLGVGNDGADPSGLDLISFIFLAKWENLPAVLLVGAHFSWAVPPIPAGLIPPVAPPTLPSVGRRYLCAVHQPVGGNFTTGKVRMDISTHKGKSVPRIRTNGYSAPA
jgi:hypothetical protein